MGRIPTIFYCPYENCSASYDRKYRYETHIRSHTGERPFVCSFDGCEKNFASSSHLKRHEDTHDSSYRCTVEGCLANLKTKATLKKHIRIVHLKIKKHKIYTCTQCGKVFNKHNVLERHELRHSGQLPYKCSVEDCQKAFLTPSKLKRHMKVHEGYPCKVPGCDKIFEKWTLYVQHARDFHRPEYKCQVCSKVFSTSYALKLHAPLHEESRLVYPCEVLNCSQYFYAERYLKWHVKRYHSKRPFMCDKEKCHRAFKTEADLANHLLYHGKKKPRKKKNKLKKPKPSLAAILSGVAEIEKVLTDEKIKSNVLASSKLDSTDLELDATKISSIDSLESNLPCIMEENSCILYSEKNVSCTLSEPIAMQNLFQSCQSNISNEIDTFSSNNNDAMEFEETSLLTKKNILEMDNLTTAEKLDSVCSAENCIIPKRKCKINYSTSEFKALESVGQEYITIEVVDNENRSQLLPVPVIQINEEHWNRTVAVHVETVS